MALNPAWPSRGDVYLVELDSTQGREIRKTRPCLIIAPDELNRYIRATIIAPMTTAGRIYPWRVECRFQGRSGVIALDQIRAVDSARLTKRFSRLASPTFNEVLAKLQEMFAS